MGKNKWYSLNKLLSYNAFINIVMSGRGMGKSFSAKKLVISQWLKDKSESVYLRRYETELKTVKNTYWNDIAPFYPHLEFEVKGDIGYINNEPVVHFIALSTSPKLKSASYPNVKNIIFDEYIITSAGYNRYLKNEMVLFFDIIETIFRSRTNTRVLVMSNSVSYVNPLFNFFDLVPKEGKRFNKFKEGLICLEVFENQTYIEDKLDTPFGRLIKDTDYGRYAIGNNTLEDSEEFIAPRDSVQYSFVSSFKHEGFEVGVWRNKITNLFYIDEKIDKSSPHRFAMQIEDNEKGFTQLKHMRGTTWRIKEVKKQYNEATILYSTQEVKKFFYNNVIKYL